MAQSDRQAREERARLRTYQARQEVHARKQRRRVRDNLIAGGVLVVVLVIATAAQLFYFNGGPGTPEAEPSTPPTAEPTETPAPEGENQGDVPSADIAEGRTWTGTLTLNDIPLGIELDGAAAPQAVSSEIALAQSGFYDGVSCHRLTTDGIYVLQCGDPTGDGTGGPGYSYGPIENAPADGLYPAGTIAMARSASAYSQGSQFFIVYQDSTLPTDTGGYSVIGRVTSGLDQLISGVVAGGTADGSTDGAPATEVLITGFTVQ
ncbi:peptidylprolyl isomerase [Agromyces larvae]|uniref:peptidylprolyl isomerase n=1 Tax=Agromyces larvae TaxID=2929802 RepID=A0ABY4C1I5_9MICO|nr:peptidylprolyl isomerase [Agromyces larvae]UOE45228.1 peptidylprolyl isomerase [Agromyces larvae]